MEQNDEEDGCIQPGFKFDSDESEIETGKPDEMENLFDVNQIIRREEVLNNVLEKLIDKINQPQKSEITKKKNKVK